MQRGQENSISILAGSQIIDFGMPNGHQPVQRGQENSISILAAYEEIDHFRQGSQIPILGRQVGTSAAGTGNSHFHISGLLRNRPFSARLPNSDFGTPNGHQCSGDRKIAFPYQRLIKKSTIFGKAPKFRFWDARWAPVRRGQENSISILAAY